MKKILTCVISAALLCGVLAGCGEKEMDKMDNVMESPIITTDVSPDMVPDTQDGAVNDTNGFTDDGNTIADGDTAANSTDKAEGTAVIPSPSASMKP